MLTDGGPSGRPLGHWGQGLAGTESVLWDLLSLSGDCCERATLATSCSGYLCVTSPSHSTATQCYPPVHAAAKGALARGKHMRLPDLRISASNTELNTYLLYMVPSLEFLLQQQNMN